MICFSPRSHHGVDGCCLQRRVGVIYVYYCLLLLLDHPIQTLTAFRVHFSPTYHHRPWNFQSRNQINRFHQLLSSSLPPTNPTETISPHLTQDQQQSLSSNIPTTQNKKPQRIAIIGAGAVGSYYGARLWEYGHDVHFLFRNYNYNKIQQDGLHITSVLGNITIPSHIIQAYPTSYEMSKAIAEKQSIDGTTAIDKNNNSTTTATCYFDWVIVALKSSSLDAIPDLIIPLLNPEKTRVLVIMNGMIEHDLLSLMKNKTRQQQHTNNNNIIEPLQCCHTWYGGMALICCNRITPCHIDHTYFGLLTAGVASTKDLTTNADMNNENAFRELFFQNNTKIDVAYDTSLLRGRWSKMIWNLPFNGISVAMGGITVDQIVNDVGLRQLAYNIMDETILVANTDLQQQYGAYNFIPLGNKERTAMMQLSDDMGPYKPSTMLDFINRRSMEVQYLFRTPLNRAKQLNISTPYLESIVLQVEAYQRMYTLF